MTKVSDVGFHLAGLGVSVAVLAPGVRLWRFPPRDPVPTTQAPAPARWAERAGQAALARAVRDTA
ncbi:MULTISPECIES: hypothetical protein [unclassified Dietzia]|uniref:hypothetical protein n=1 Tax=unclassified Dietzia TaxID=2617939 RepID=UPI0012E6F49F|nr:MULTISPECIES: hypothetical protein [unclassified Dietzia]